MSDNYGMTLLEIAIAASIICLIIGLAIPSIITIMPRFQLNSQASLLQGDLQRARLNAVSLNTDYRVIFTLASNPDPDIFRGEFYDPNKADWDNDPEMISQQINKNIDIVFINNPSNNIGSFSIEFEPDGSSSFENTNMNTAIYLTNTKELRKKETPPT